MTKVGDITEFDLNKLLFRNEVEFDELWDILEKKTGFKINNLREFVRKKQTIDKIFFRDLKLSNYSQIILLIDYEEIFNNLVTDLLTLRIASLSDASILPVPRATIPLRFLEPNTAPAPPRPV